jgi:selenium-binding protein 1
VSCWGSGEFRQYDVSDPFQPKLNSTVRIGGIVRRAGHPAKPETPLNGGPQMVEVSRDGRRVYVTNSLYTAVDDQFYPDGIKGWMMKLDVDPITSEMHVDPRFFPHFDGMRPHQTKLEGGDASSDSYCYA